MWENAVHLAVAGGVYDGVFVLSFFPRDVLDGILDLIESVSLRVFLPTLVNPNHLYGSLPKTSNTLNIRTPKIIAKYNFKMFP